MAWRADDIAFLKAHYPTGMPIIAIARATRHHPYEVNRKALELELPRSSTAPSLKYKSSLPLPAKHGGPAFINASLDVVIEWLRLHGHGIIGGSLAGTYRIGFIDSMTPQQVVRFANNKRARCGPNALPPYVVDAGTGWPLPTSSTGYSLTGSSI